MERIEISIERGIPAIDSIQCKLIDFLGRGKVDKRITCCGGSIDKKLASGLENPVNFFEKKLEV